MGERVRLFPSDRLRLVTRAALMLAIFLAGCGVPGEPLPPLLEIPAPVSDLAATQIGNKIQLAWSVPQLTTEGTRVRRLDRMELYGAFLHADATAAEFAAELPLLSTIKPDSSPSQPISYAVPLERKHLGQRAFFAVKAINTKNKDAGLSNIPSVQVADLPEPPAQLHATVMEKAIRLEWKAAESSAMGGPAPQATSYQIFRADADSPNQAQQIGTADTPIFEDSSFEFAHKYIYSVCAFSKAGESVAVTPASLSVEVDAVDVFPPAAPRNVRAIAVPGAVDLSWSPNEEPDLGGYNVYRNSGAEFTKLNSEPLAIPVWRDAKAAAGMRYAYVVRAVDKNGNESVPSEAVAATPE
ncbi:MAG: hypothetical protein HYX72_13820 [Acidobacteria bacterium]|nr:hypothetical protein [Acidobacteriota bacterium]